MASIPIRATVAWDRASAGQDPCFGSVVLPTAFEEWELRYNRWPISASEEQYYLREGDDQKTPVHSGEASWKYQSK